MNLIRRQSIFLGLAGSLSFCVTAKDTSSKSELPSDPKKLNHLQHHLQSPRVVGKGLYSVWGFDIYHATLWGSEKTFKPEQWHTQRLALELRYARSFNSKEIAKRSIDEIHIQSQIPTEKVQSWLKILEDLFPNVDKDQTITGIYLPGENSQFLFNDKPIGSISDLDLSQRFFAIWLSPKTTAPALRKALFNDTIK